ncbi:hypothetical protein Tco_0294760 [Tanacetum coccineum]
MDFHISHDTFGQASTVGVDIVIYPCSNDLNGFSFSIHLIQLPSATGMFSQPIDICMEDFGAIVDEFTLGMVSMYLIDSGFHLERNYRMLTIEWTIFATRFMIAYEEHSMIEVANGYLAFGRHLEEIHVTWAHLRRNGKEYEPTPTSLKNFYSEVGDGVADYTCLVLVDVLIRGGGGGVFGSGVGGAVQVVSTKLVDELVLDVVCGLFDPDVGGVMDSIVGVFGFMLDVVGGCCLDWGFVVLKGKTVSSN